MADEVKVGDRLEDLKTGPDGGANGGVWTVKEVIDGPGGRQDVVIERLVTTERVIEADLIGPRWRPYRPVTESPDG